MKNTVDEISKTSGSRVKNRLAVLTAFAVGFVFRLVSELFTVDAVTGMILPEYKVISIVLSALAIISVGVMFCFVSGRKDVKATVVSPNILIALISLVIAVISIVEGFSLTPAETTPMWQIFFAKVIGVINGVFFFSFAFSGIFKNSIPKFMFAIPLVCFIVKLIRFFAETTMLALITDNVFSLFFYSSAIFFMLEFANVENSIGGTKSFKKLLLSGYLTAAFSMLSSIPRILVLLLRDGAVAHESIPSTLMTLFIGIFAFLLTYNVFNKSKKDTNDK